MCVCVLCCVLCVSVLFLKGVRGLVYFKTLWPLGCSMFRTLQGFTTPAVGLPIKVLSQGTGFVRSGRELFSPELSYLTLAGLSYLTLEQLLSHECFLRRSVGYSAAQSYSQGSSFVRCFLSFGDAQTGEVDDHFKNERRTFLDDHML